MPSEQPFDCAEGEAHKNEAEGDPTGKPTKEALYNNARSATIRGGASEPAEDTASRHSF